VLYVRSVELILVVTGTAPVVYGASAQCTIAKFCLLCFTVLNYRYLVNKGWVINHACQNASFVANYLCDKLIY